MSGSFDSQGWGECDANYYLKGLYRSEDGKKRSGLFNIETLKCCQTQNGAGDFSALTKCEDYDITGLFDQPFVWAVCPPADTKAGADTYSRSEKSTRTLRVAKRIGDEGDVAQQLRG